MPFDPNFPDRPQTREFDRIAGATSYNDALTDAGRSLEDVCKDLGVGLEEMLYVGDQRALFVARAAAGPLHTVLWMDGFAAGVRYAQQKSHE